MRLTTPTKKEVETTERRATELGLRGTDKAAYLRFLLQSDRGEYHILCPDCGAWVETYETDIIRHVRTCLPLQAAVEAP